MEKQKPIGWRPDGDHINKKAIVVIILVLIGVYCIYADNPFGMGVETVIEVVAPK